VANPDKIFSENSRCRGDSPQASTQKNYAAAVDWRLDSLALEVLQLAAGQKGLARRATITNFARIK
jgi:hypothetical protein